MSIRANKDNAVFISKAYLQEDGDKASATVTFATNPIDGQNINLEGTVFTYRTTPAVANDVQVGASISASIDNLLAESLPISATYTKVGTNQIFIEYATIGTVGNGYTIASNFTAVPSSLSGGSDTPDTDWVDNTPTIDYKLPEITIEGDSTSTALVTHTVVNENDQVKVYNGIEGLLEGNLGNITLTQGTSFVAGAATGTSGTFVVPEDGHIDIAMAGGGGGGGSYSGTNGGGGGGSGLVVVKNIPVTKGQVIPYTIGVGAGGGGAAGGTTSILGYTALGGGGGKSGGIGGAGGNGVNGGGNGGTAGANGSKGTDWVFDTLSISITSVGGTPNIGGKYGGGGSLGGDGIFGGGGGGASSTIGIGRGGDGYIYIAFAPNKRTADITSLGLFNPPTKAWLNKPIAVFTATEANEARCIAKDETLAFAGSTLTLYQGTNAKSGLITTGDSIRLNGTTDVVCSNVVETDLGGGSYKYTCTIPSQASAPTSAKVLDRSTTATEASDTYDNVNDKFIKTYNKVEQEGRAMKYKIESDEGVEIIKLNIEMNKQG